MFFEKLQQWSNAFAAVLKRSQSPAGRGDFTAAAMLDLCLKVTTVLLAAGISAPETIFDKFHSTFAEIVADSKTLIEDWSYSRLPGNARFSFDIGVVLPLYVTAVKCRDPVLRRKAISLLFSSPRREGMWDSVLAARVAVWITSIEEEGLEAPHPNRRAGNAANHWGIAEEQRVGVRFFNLDLQKREARLRCARKVLGMEGEVNARETTIFW